MPPKNIAGNTPTGVGSPPPNSKKPKFPQKNKLRLFLEEHYISALVGGGAALLMWLLVNLLDNQILEKIGTLEKSYTSEKDARTAADSELDKRLAIIEHDHDKQNIKPTK